MAPRHPHQGFQLERDVMWGLGCRIVAPHSMVALVVVAVACQLDSGLVILLLLGPWHPTSRLCVSGMQSWVIQEHAAIFYQNLLY